MFNYHYAAQITKHSRAANIDGVLSISQPIKNTADLHHLRMRIAVKCNVEPSNVVVTSLNYLPLVNQQ
ncbi:hypothetical protein tloyanaT_25940 [Thalassotalea loyana]|uniref:Uncharacterized protein n=1 Tax=Thalassotalea loyana TaxID=280483 RepID=A0ABQ6HHH2_9GAMM|nr:hypothetical protein [Thalassotalea loyana]GLX86341.1 hypothetical protein tloyanaT_25940 [Thalassotalea loyana]